MTASNEGNVKGGFRNDEPRENDLFKWSSLASSSKIFWL